MDVAPLADLVTKQRKTHMKTEYNSYMNKDKK